MRNQFKHQLQTIFVPRTFGSVVRMHNLAQELMYGQDLWRG